MAFGGEVVLPRRRLVGSVAGATDRENGRSRLLGTSMPLDLRIADEHDRASRRVERLVVEREGRAPVSTT